MYTLYMHVVCLTTMCMCKVYHCIVDNGHFGEYRLRTTIIHARAYNHTRQGVLIVKKLYAREFVIVSVQTNTQGLHVGDMVGLAGVRMYCCLEPLGSNISLNSSMLAWGYW